MYSTLIQLTYCSSSLGLAPLSPPLRHFVQVLFLRGYSKFHGTSDSVHKLGRQNYLWNCLPLNSQWAPENCNSICPAILEKENIPQSLRIHKREVVQS